MTRTLLHLEHGLLRVREHTFDMRRLRGGTLREPLLVRLFGGARLDAVMTGVGGAGEASLLLPPCPRATAETVLAELIARPEAVTGPLRAHGAVATRRRWTRALALPAVLLVAMVAMYSRTPVWLWPVWAVLTVCCALLAFDRSRALGHRVDAQWLVARAGSLDRRRDCIAAAGIIGWTVRQTLLQRRAGVATLIAATAAGVKSYRVIDVPAELAWSIAAAASPWVADNAWARSTESGSARRLNLTCHAGLWRLRHNRGHDYRPGTHRRVRSRLRGRGGVLPRRAGIHGALAAVRDGSAMPSAPTWASCCPIRR